MLYKGHLIKIWKSEWIDRIINGENYSLDTCFYYDTRTPGQYHKYVAIIDQVNPQHGYEIWGASTPLIALDLAKFSVDLKLANYRWRTLRKDSKGLMTNV
jgi:hypothetical protein